jgi:putative flippase GtrA
LGRKDSLIATLVLFVRFAGVGVIGTLAHYVTLVLLVEIFGAGPVTASSSGYLVGALINYLLNYFYTFRSNRRHIEALPRFYLVAAVGFVFNGTIMFLLVRLLNVNYLVAQIVATTIVLVWNFIANKIWTFTEAED